MKKILTVLFALILAACDRPIATTVLRPEAALGDLTGPITLRIYDVDNVIATIHGQDIKLVPQGIMGNDNDAIQPELAWDCTYDDQTFTIHGIYDTENKTVHFKYITYITDQYSIISYSIRHNYPTTFAAVDFKDGVPARRAGDITNNCDTAMKKCDNGQEIYLSCPNFRNAAYEYITLVKCPNDSNIICMDNGISAPQTISAVIDREGFDTVDYLGTNGIAVGYLPSENIYVARDPSASSFAVRCTQTIKLEQHKICARRINSIIVVAEDGGIAVDIAQKQVADRDGREITHNYVTLTQEQALSITPNWDYANIKLYIYGTEPHEADACDALQKLEQIRSNLQSKETLGKSLKPSGTVTANDK